jgi:hypothetical protein
LHPSVTKLFVGVAGEPTSIDAKHGDAV